MNKCIICGKQFTPNKEYPERLTCSKECWNELKRQTVSDNFLKTSFKKGNVPYNKGIPQCEWISEEGRKNCSKTHIQYQDCKSPLSEIEGRYLPHNTNQKGTVTLRKHTHMQSHLSFHTHVLWLQIQFYPCINKPQDNISCAALILSLHGHMNLISLYHLEHHRAQSS